MPAPPTDVLRCHSSIRDLQALPRARTGAGSGSPPGERQAAHLASLSPPHRRGNPLHLSWPAPRPRRPRPSPAQPRPCTVSAPRLHSPRPFPAQARPLQRTPHPMHAPDSALSGAPPRAPPLSVSAGAPHASPAPTLLLRSEARTLRPHRPAHPVPSGLRVPPGRLRSPPFFPPAY